MHKRYRKYFRYLAILGALFSGAVGAAQASEEDVVVFAAASATEVVSALSTEFEKRTGFPVISSFAGSGTLARQIYEGAPADIFIAANMAWLTYLDEARLLEAGSIVKIASNNLVLVAPKDTLVPDPFDFQKLPDLLAGERIAIGNPAHVPAGNYAKSALQFLDLWRVLRDQFVYLPNVRSVLALVERGEVPYAIVYATDVRLAKNVRIVAVFPRESHPQIAYGMAKIRDNDGHSTNLFYDFVKSADGQEIFRRFGFVTKVN